MTTGKEQRRLAAVMFCDIRGYTALVQKDEGAALKKVSKFRRVLESHTEAHHGEVIEFYGDGSLSVYPSVVKAIECAIQMQQDYLAEETVEVRIGIHFGDIVFREGTVYGDGVNLASRIEAQGEPGAVLVSDKVKKELQNHPTISTLSLGEFRLKNVDEPVEIHAIEHPSIIVPRDRIENLRKRKRVLLFQKILVGVLFTALVITLLQFVDLPVLGNMFGKSKGGTPADIFREKIAVQQFQNNTFRDSLDLIGDMAGDYLSRELLKTDKANVIAYRTSSELENSGVLQAAAASGPFERSAVYLITGSFRLVGQDRDSILFSASVQNTANGEMLHGFADQTAPLSDPFSGLEKLNSQIKGYWESKGQHVTVPPNYQAYKAFLQAREAWFANDSIVIAELRKAIRLDSSFTDPYFYLFTRYFDLGQYTEAADVLDRIEVQSAGFSDRQKRQVRQMEADLAGRNVEAYQLFMEEYAEDPGDLFVNGAAMAYTMEYVNDPEKAARIFEEIPLDRFSDYSACAYCLERLYIAQMAYLLSGKFKKAAAVIKAFPRRMGYQKYFIGQVPYYVSQLDTAGIGFVRQNLLASELDPSLVAILHLVAARAFRLRGEEQLVQYYTGRSLDELGERLSFLRGEVLYLKGDDDAAYAETSRLLAQYPDYQAAVFRLGVLAARLGKKEEALAQADRLAAFDEPYTYGQVPYQQAAIHAQLGNTALALEKLEVAISEGCKFQFLNRFESDPDLMPLHDIPAFQDLIHPLD